jgi:multidrug resistance efflux pump
MSFDLTKKVSRKGAKARRKSTQGASGIQSLSVLPLRLCAFTREVFIHLAKTRFQYLALLTLLLLSTACQSKSDNASRGIIIVNSPATGEVRRVLVREGASVNEGAAIVEIAVMTEGQAAAPTTQAEDPQKRAARTVESAQSEIEAARAEVVRTEVEVNRLTPLVTSGDAPQAQLDGARADYDRAQQRLRKAQDSAQNAQSGLVAARQPAQQNSAPAPATATTEQLVTARASSAGTVSAISIQAGQHVTAGQPLATLRAE